MEIFISTFFASIGASGLLLLLLRILGNSWVKKIDHRLTTELTKVRTKLNRYADRQFDAYNELWISICELKVLAENLWESASRKKILEFNKYLNKTKTALERSSIYIEDQHYQSLSNIMLELDRFLYGKENLIDIRGDLNDRINNREMIRSQINENRDSIDKIKIAHETIKGLLKEYLSSTNET